MLTSRQCHWLQNFNEHSHNYSILVLSLEKARVVSSHAASTSTVVNSLNGYSSKEKDPANGRDKQSLNSTLEFCKKSQLEAELQQAKQMAMTLQYAFY